MSREEFWRLSWYDVGIHLERFTLSQEALRAKNEQDWNRTRVMWATLININTGKKGKKVKPQDLIKLSIDDNVPVYHKIDLEAIKRRFGSKIKKRGQ